MSALESTDHLRGFCIEQIISFSSGEVRVVSERIRGYLYVLVDSKLAYPSSKISTLELSVHNKKWRYPI